MKQRDELMESLLSNRFSPTPQVVEDIDRLNRKVSPYLPELRQHPHRSHAKPLLCLLTFNPQSRFIICWEVINIFLIYIYFMEIPIILAFENHRSEEENQQFFQIVNFPAAATFAIGIFINFNTSFYEDGLLRKDPRDIFRNYLRSSFVPDLVSTASILLYELVELLQMEQRQTLKYVVLLVFLKVIDLMKIERTIISSFDLNRRIKAALKLLLLLMKIFLICNIVACGAFYLSDKLARSNNILLPDGTPCREACYWVVDTKYAQVSLVDLNSFNIQYIYSLYWASTTMISIGYGDITPQNPYQITYTIIIQFLSCLLYGYAINHIWSIIQQLNAKTTKIHSRLNIINIYMRDKQITPELMSRINAYLNNYYYAKNLREKEIEAEIIGELTPALKKELYYQSYSVIFKHKLFASLSDQLIKGISQYVREVTYYEDEVVFLKEAAVSPSLYYVRKGELLHFTGGQGRIALRNVYTSDFVGIYEFVTQLNHQSVLKTVKYSLTYLLKFADWHTMMERFPLDFETFYQLRDDIILYQELRRIKYSCFFCNGNHRTEFCFDQSIRLDAISNRGEILRQESNEQKKYPRREVRVNYVEKVERPRRKISTYSDLKTFNRMQDQSSFHAKISTVDSLQITRKQSNDIDQPWLRRGGRLAIKHQKTKTEHNRAIERIRKEYASKNQIQGLSESEWSEDDIKAEDVSMDVLANYSQYYPEFNPSDFKEREQNRRRMTHSFV